MSNATEYAEFIELLELFSQSDLASDRIQTETDAAVLQTVATRKAEFASTKAVRDEAEEKIKALARKHPEWLDGKSIKTPFGVVQLRDSTSLDVPNPEATLLLIKASASMPGAQFTYEQLTRAVIEPNLEALEALSDEQLSKLGITRVKSQSVSVKRQKVDLGKKGKPKADAVPVPAGGGAA